MSLDEILDAAQAKIDADGYDPAIVVGAALEFMAEHWADDERSLCPSCGKRRLTKSESLCTWCAEQRERQLEYKLRWWHSPNGGAAQRAQRREAAQAISESQPA